MAVHVTFLTLLSFFVISIDTCNAGGNTIYVDDDGGANYTNISDAINAASENDTIYVYSGIYNENILINKNIKLIGAGIGSAVINGNSGHTIKINQNNVQISNFTITNTGETYYCLYINYVRDCLIKDNVVKYGANGIYILGSEDNTIEDNTIENNNVGVHISNSYGNIIKSNNIQKNVMNGVFVTSTSSGNMIYQNDFADNYDSNGRDDGSNYWDYNFQGNYWDDYNDYDSNGNGTGDNPYIISGTGENKDNYPLGDFLTQKPEAIIDYISPNPASKGTNIYFNGHATGSVSKYEWCSSINGFLSNSRNYQTSSLSVGTHTISYRVMDNEGIWSDYDYKTLIIIAPNQKPNAYILEPTDFITKIYGEEIDFLGDWSDDGQVVEYFWRSSIDDYLSNTLHFTKNNLSIGQHNIYFKVKDNYGEWSPESMVNVIILSNSSNNAPIAVSGGPYSGVVNQSVKFDASDSYDADEGDSITSYRWDFGDGSTGEGMLVVHRYSSEGNFTVNLIVTDGNGEQKTDTTYVNISSQAGNQKENKKKDSPGFEVFSAILTITILIFYKKKKGK